MVSLTLSNPSNFLAPAPSQFSLILLLSAQFHGIKVGLRKIAKAGPDTGNESAPLRHPAQAYPASIVATTSDIRYDSARDEFDGRVENQPYTILIQLPKREDKYGDDNYVHKKRKYEKISIPLYDNENDYIYDESDTDSKVVNLNDKKVYIKMVKGEHPKLQIQISRSDNEGNIKGTKILPILPKIHENFTPSVQSETRAFTPHENF
ncbi:hypothetical protein WN48_00018 [Eufriesea mexicana]|uniref:Uncharacterized protein n=1 Tax=Eufriesea mexicana TaxID=516756 RepID=A0A310SLF6_9HYME|nr:hypothetical protein WN48_00018 [Eufriesea mexicana]